VVVPERGEEPEHRELGRRERDRLPPLCSRHGRIIVRTGLVCYGLLVDSPAADENGDQDERPKHRHDAQAFERETLFHGVVQQMISAGEQSGDLGTPLVSVANYFESLWAQRLESVISTVNPLLTATMGMLISGMLIAAFLPVFEVSGLAVQ